MLIVVRVFMLDNITNCSSGITWYRAKARHLVLDPQQTACICFDIFYLYQALTTDTQLGDHDKPEWILISIHIDLF